MARRIVRTICLVVACAGFLAVLGLLATPWEKLSVKAGGQVNLHKALGVGVFHVHLGGWYLAGLIATGALLATAIAGEPAWRRRSGGLAFVLGIMTAGVAVMIGGSADTTAGAAHALGFADVAVRGAAGPGVWFGIAASLLLGLAGALAAAASARAREGVEARVP